jgi:hypothetical protein
MTCATASTMTAAIVHPAIVRTRISSPREFVRCVPRPWDSQKQERISVLKTNIKDRFIELKICCLPIAESESQ